MASATELTKVVVTYNLRFVERGVKCGVGKGLCSLEELTAFLEVCMQSHFSSVRLFAIPWAVARQVLLYMGFSKQEYWSGLPCPSAGESFGPRDRTLGICIASRLLTSSSVQSLSLVPSLPPAKPERIARGISRLKKKIKKLRSAWDGHIATSSG